MTSANVTNFRIRRKDTKVAVGIHRQHAYCKPRWQELLKYQPLTDFEIQPWGLDEEEEEWEDQWHNLRDFLLVCRVKIE
jgi:hypothetical protein